MSAKAAVISLGLLAAQSLAAPPAVSHNELPIERGLTDGAYAPYQADCPSNYTWVRNATDGLSAGETAFVAARQEIVRSTIETMMAAHGLDTPSKTPVIGVALAGGGYRAMLTGLGGIEGMMNASTEGADSGIGGWLDGVTYWAGLSGGSWGTMSFMANGGALPSDLLNDLWDLESNLIYPDDGKLSFYADLYAEVNAKDDTGFPVQITDLWGLALGTHVLPTDYQLTYTPNLTFSNLPSVVAALGNASLPMPIIIAAEREEGELVIAENATVWEFTPYEFGSWAFGSTYKSPGAFTPLDYLGTSVDNGTANGTCWKGFDQVSFIIGTSATLFNGAFLDLNSSSTSSVITSFVTSILADIGEDQYDVSRIPNTFYNYNTGENPIADYEYVTLVDAGETNQNIPIEPLLIPFRGVDAIIAFDSSYDTDYIWPNGTALRTTYERASVLAEHNDTKFNMPEVPSENGFINGGYNTRPTFFGCNDTTTPVIVYIPTYPWSYASNISTYQLSYDDDVALAVLNNGLRSLTLNGTVETWPACLACALTDRAFDYTTSNRSSTCQSCFDTWCWAGDDNTTDPGVYEPVINSVPPWLLANNLSLGVADAPGSDDNSTSTSSNESGAGRLGVSIIALLMAAGAALII